MDSKLTMIIVFASALAGAGIALSAGHFAGSSTASNPETNLLERIEKLEADLLAERNAREEWASAMMAERAQLSPGRLAATDTEEFEIQEPATTELAGAELLAAEQAASGLDLSASSRAELRRQNRKRALLANGFDDTEANWILSNEAQVQLDELFDQHKLRRAALADENAESNLWFNRKTRQDRLREKLGDESFEKYLKANGWPTSARVQRVIGGSPAALAGLKDGDQIMSYAGERVFNLRDVNRLTLQGTEGESVLVEVERDGNTIQVTIPRGPVGVSGG